MAEGSQSKTGRFALNMLSSVLTTLISMTVLVWVNQFLLKRVSAEEFALIPVITSLLMVGEMLKTMFTGGLSRFMVEARAAGKLEEMTRITSSMLLVLIPGSLAVAGIGVLVIFHIEQVIAVAPEFVDTAQMMLGMLLLMLCLTIACTPISGGLYVQMRFVEINLIRLGTELLRVILLLILLYGVSASALWLILASTVGGVADLTIRVGYTWRILPEARFRPRLATLATVRRLMSFSLWTTFQSFTHFVQRSAPVLVLNWFGSAVDVSAFHVGNLADTQVRRIITAAAGPAQPELTVIFATKGSAALRPLYYRGGRYLLWATLAFAAPLTIFAYPATLLYAGSVYLDAAAVMILVLGAYPLIWASGMFYQVSFAVGRIRAFTICSLVLSLTVLAGLGLFVAVLKMGAVGAALAVGGAFALVHLFMIWPLGLRFVGGNWTTFLRETLIPGTAPFLAGVAVGIIFLVLVAPISWPLLSLGAMLVWIAYAGTLLGACCNPADWVLIRRFATRIRPGNGPQQ